MCLAVPAKVIEVDADRYTARVDYLGSQIAVGIALLEGVAPGDYVLVHVGEAIALIDAAHAEEGIALWKEWANEE